MAESHFKNSNLSNLAVPLKLALEVPGDGHPEPDAHVRVEVHSLRDRLSIAPLGHDMLLNPDSFSFPVHCPAITYTIPVEPGRDVLAILPVKEDNPTVKLLDFREQVPVLPRLGTIVLKPYKLWGVKEGGNDKFIFYSCAQV